MKDRDEILKLLAHMRNIFITEVGTLQLVELYEEWSIERATLKNVSFDCADYYFHVCRSELFRRLNNGKENNFGDFTESEENTDLQ